MSSGEWGLAGKPTTTADVQGLLQAGQEAGVR
jgi:hypothetical protein